MLLVAMAQPRHINSSPHPAARRREKKCEWKITFGNFNIIFMSEASSLSLISSSVGRRKKIKERILEMLLAHSSDALLTRNLTRYNVI